MSDKTGTLTRNVMKFKRVSVGGENYGDNENDEFCDPDLIKHLNENQVYLFILLRNQKNIVTKH